MRTEIERDANSIIASNRPKPKSNTGRVCSEFAAWHTLEYAKERKEELGTDIKANMLPPDAFDASATFEVYVNGSFAVTVTQKNAPRTFNRERALIAIATRFKLTADEAMKFLDEQCYAGGTGTKQVSITATVK